MYNSALWHDNKKAIAAVLALLMIMFTYSCGGGGGGGGSTDDGGFAPDGTDIAPPTVPENLKVWAISATAIQLSWSPSSDNTSVAAYQVIRGGAEVARVNSPGHIDQSVTEGVEYCYQVIAYDLAGNFSEASEEACATGVAGTLNIWGQVYGDPARDEELFFVDSTSDGGFIAVGYSRVPGGPEGDIYLLRVDGGGNVVFEKVFGWAGDDRGQGVRQTTDGGFIIIGTSDSFGSDDDIILVKTDSEGEPVWERAFVDVGFDEGGSVLVDTDGGYVFVGTNEFTTTGDLDAWLVKTDSRGNKLWEEILGFWGAHETGRSLERTKDGGLVVSGTTRKVGGYSDHYLVKVKSDGSLLWEVSYGGAYDELAAWAVEMDGGGFMLAGSSESYVYGNSYYNLILTGPTGVKLSELRYGFNGTEEAMQVVRTPDGGFAIVGSLFSINSDIWLLKVDSDGQMLWHKHHGGNSNDYGYSVIQSADGGLLVAGSSRSGGTGGSLDAYLVKTDQFGDSK